MTSSEINLRSWLTPDKLGGSVLNPQSLNRYAYVTNNPASFNDPSGLIRNDPWGCFTGSTGFGYYCPNASDEQPSDFGVGFVNPILPRFLPGGNGHGAFLIHMTVTSAAPAAGQPALAGSNWAQRLGCAAQYGDNHSLAAFFGVQHNAIGNAFLGNSVSGLLNLGISVFGGGPAPSPVQTALTSTGLPFGGPGAMGVVGMAQGAAARAFFNALPSQSEPLITGITGAAATPASVVPNAMSVTGATAELGAEAAPAAADVFAGIVAWGKFGVDFGIDLYAYSYGPCSQ